MIIYRKLKHGNQRQPAWWWLFFTLADNKQSFFALVRLKLKLVRCRSGQTWMIGGRSLSISANGWCSLCSDCRKEQIGSFVTILNQMDCFN